MKPTKLRKPLGILAAAAMALSFGAAPASAGPTEIGSETHYDRVGDAPPRADIHRTTVTATEGAFWATTRLGNLWGQGRYRVYLAESPWDARGFRARAVVTKELGKAPVATLFTRSYENGWVRTPCAMVVGWDTGTDIVKVQVPRRCAVNLQWATTVMAADFTSGSITDRIGLDDPYN